MRWMLPALILCLAPASAAYSEEVQSSSQATRSGFKVVVLITTDANWREKWDTPPETTPHFRGPGIMKPGEKATVLTFFSNAQLRNGNATLHCDVAVLNPDGTGDTYAPQPCYVGPAPDARGLYLTGLEIGFEVSPNDLSGIHGFEIGVTDMHRGVRVPVKVTVEFDTGKGAT